MERLLAIGEFSQLCGLSQKRLRSYGASGLLTPTAVDPDTGYRYYSPDQLADAQAIDALRRSGMSLHDIKSVLHAPSGTDLECWADSIRVEAQRKEEALGAARRLLATGRLRAPATEPATGRSSMQSFDATGRSEIGAVRENNEDSILTGDRLVAVADGMGGHPGGEVASSLATELIAATFKSRSLDSLETVVRAANWVVWQQASSAPQLEGMGTTICVAGLVEGGRLALASVGDSRAYLVQRGEIRRLTEDHTITAELVRRGELSEEEASEHPERNILTRALGVGPEVEIDIDQVEVASGDVLLLCSDGLFTELPEDEIRAVMLSKAAPSAMVDTLVEQALTNGGHDNVSVVIATIEP